MFFGWKINLDFGFVLLGFSIPPLAWVSKMDAQWGVGIFITCSAGNTIHLVLLPLTRLGVSPSTTAKMSQLFFYVVCPRKEDWEAPGNKSPTIYYRIVPRLLPGNSS